VVELIYKKLKNVKVVPLWY